MIIKHKKWQTEKQTVFSDCFIFNSFSSHFLVGHNATDNKHLPEVNEDVDKTSPSSRSPFLWSLLQRNWTKSNFSSRLMILKSVIWKRRLKKFPTKKNRERKMIHISFFILFFGSHTEVTATNHGHAHQRQWPHPPLLPLLLHRSKLTFFPFLVGMKRSIRRLIVYVTQSINNR